MLEIIDIAAKRRKRRIRGVNAAIAPGGNLMAWQTPVDEMTHPDEHSHVLLSDVRRDSPLDLGEGTAPVFLPGGTQLSFVRLDPATQEFDVVVYDVRTQRQEVQHTRGVEFLRGVYDFSVSPDGSTRMLSTDGGRYGTAVYWRMTSNGDWTLVENNLDPWGGWSRNGWLIYATDGRDLRPLDASRTVWVGDIKLLDQRTGQTRTVVSGISMNQQPHWCQAAARK